MIIIGMIKDDEDDDNLGDGHDCHGKKTWDWSNWARDFNGAKLVADPVFLFYVDFKFFSIFCDIALLLCGQIKYFQKRKPVIMSNGCLWRQAVVDRRMQATEMCTPCHHHYATMQLCTPPPPPLVALQLCTECIALHTTTTMQLCTPYHHHYAFNMLSVHQHTTMHQLWYTLKLCSGPCLHYQLCNATMHASTLKVQYT